MKCCSFQMELFYFSFGLREGMGFIRACFPTSITYTAQYSQAISRENFSQANSVQERF